MIILHTEHSIFGSLLVPYIAEKFSDDRQLRLVEQAFHASPQTVAQMSEAQQEAIRIASHYSEKYLMMVFSREKTVARFLQKLSDDPERIRTTIRPYIEKKLLEMVQTVINGSIPVYQRAGTSKILFPHHAYRIHSEPVETSFFFEANREHFSYQLQCSFQGEPLPLTALKPVTTLTTQPCTLLLGMHLFRFNHIEAARILPFTRKETVSVPVTHLSKYMDNIVVPIACYHPVSTSGLDLADESVPCETLLFIEEDLDGQLQLRLSFRYGSQEFVPGKPTGIRHFLPRRENDPATTLRFFRRDTEKEKDDIHRLLHDGLKQTGETTFSPEGTQPLNEWLIAHRALLEERYHLADALSKRSYCLDEILIEQSWDDGPDWFDLHITVVAGPFRIPFERFRKHILEERREYVLPDDRILLLPEEWFARYANLAELGESHGKGIRLKRPFVGVVEELFANHSGKLPLFPDGAALPEPPAGLKATLRPYQSKGFAWMQHLYEHTFGGILADDMGLGKTLQTLALLQYIYRGKSGENSVADETGRRQAEDTMWTSFPSPVDEMGQFLLFGDNDVDNPPTACRQEPDITPRHAPARKPATLVVVPTSLLHNWRRETRRFTGLSVGEFNAETRFRKGHPELFFGKYHLVLTSYGMMRNHIDTLQQYCFEYVVLDESQNIKNSDSLTFRTAIRLRSHHRLVLTGTPIENSLKDLWAQFHFLQPDLLGSETDFVKQFINPIRQNDTRKETRLRQLISPFILRRSKHEVAPELPPLTEEVIYCDMSEEQDNLYRLEKNSLRNTLLEARTPGERHQQLTVLNGITRLRQLSCHPQMIFPDFTGLSGKLEQVIDTFETLRSEGHKVLIFSSFVKHLELIASAFRERQWPYALLTGSSTDRPAEIARFAQSDDIQAFLISLKAGGVGLNLTQADYVFIIDPWWNPAAEAQAIARAHRIGQEKQVIAYRFITQGSIEEKIVQLQEDKRRLAGVLITESEALPPLSDTEWMELLK